MDRLTTTLRKPNAWGRDRVVTVTWMPEDITELVDPVFANTGRKIIAFGDPTNPPIRLERDNVGGGVSIMRSIRSFDGAYSYTCQFSRVDSEADLEPGTFFIVSDSDDA